MKKTIILGNIIKKKKKRPFAKAAVVKNGVFSSENELKPQ